MRIATAKAWIKQAPSRGTGCTRRDVPRPARPSSARDADAHETRSSIRNLGVPGKTTSLVSGTSACCTAMPRMQRYDRPVRVDLSSRRCEAWKAQSMRPTTRHLNVRRRMRRARLSSLRDWKRTTRRTMSCTHDAATRDIASEYSSSARSTAATTRLTTPCIHDAANSSTPSDVLRATSDVHRPNSTGLPTSLCPTAGTTATGEDESPSHARHLTWRRNEAA